MLRVGVSLSCHCFPLTNLAFESDCCSLFCSSSLAFSPLFRILLSFFTSILTHSVIPLASLLSICGEDCRVCVSMCECSNVFRQHSVKCVTLTALYKGCIIYGSVLLCPQHLLSSTTSDAICFSFQSLTMSFKNCRTEKIAEGLQTG